MKYLKTYAPEWDEVFQVEFEDDDPTLNAMPSYVSADLSDRPFRGLPIRPRSRATADKQRLAEHKRAAA